VSKFEAHSGAAPSEALAGGELVNEAEHCDQNHSDEDKVLPVPSSALNKIGPVRHREQSQSGALVWRISNRFQNRFSRADPLLR
jgi:hypothetical protein